MRYLIAFFKRYSFFFLFVLFEAIALVWIMNGTVYQRNVMSNTTRSMAGTVFETVDNITDYAFLGRQNKKLQLENARLRNELNSAYFHPHNDSSIYDTINYVTRDSAQKRRFIYEPVDIIHNTVNKVNNYIMIDKGNIFGIEQDMGIVSDNGVVGIITASSENYSWVMSMLNVNLKLSAMIKKNHQLGTVVWEGNDFLTGLMKDVPAHVDVRKGDTLVTSGYSQIFPENILIGVVDEVLLNETNNLYSIRFRYSVDFNSLDYGYVIKNLYTKEIEEISQIEKPVE